MQNPKKLADEISGLVYTPTLIAYVWMGLHLAIAGACLYLIALFVTYKSGAFNKLSQWPTLAKWVLYSGALLVLLGLYFSTRPTAYFMMIPLVIQAAFSIVGWLALRGADAKASEQ